MTKTSAIARNTEPAGNRRIELLEAAARRFAKGGFDATSMRDIAGDVGMLAGSMYHHFASKDEMIAAVYALGVEQVEAAVVVALKGKREPWACLEAACAAHMEALLAESPFAAVLTADLSRLAPGVRRSLIALRDRYEIRFAELMENLPLPPSVDRRLLRLQLLGALNWTPTWYTQGGTSPRDIAKAYVHALRRR